MKQNWQNIKLCLASASPRRLTLLQQVGIEPHVQASQLEEKRKKNEKIKDYVERMAITKAVHTPCEGVDLILAADTIVVLGDKLMGKPHDDRQARRMLKQLSGRTHKVMTAIALLRPQDSRIMSRVVTTRVTFKPLRKGEINQYIASKEPLDKAGAYGIQGLGALLVKKIHGSYSGVVGLPLTETVAMIQRLARMKKPVEP